MVITNWKEGGNGKYDMKHVPRDEKAGMEKQGCFCAEGGSMVTWEVGISLLIWILFETLVGLISSSFFRSPNLIKLDMAQSELWQNQGCAVENENS